MAGKNKLAPRFARRAMALSACVVAYLVWPYVTLYRLGDALRHGDVETLTADVEWDAVREGLKEDIADQIIPKPAVATLGVSDALPPFGSGFAAGIAGNMVDQAVTPTNLAAGQSASQMGQTMGNEALRWAWFSGLTHFEAKFQVLAGDGGMAPVRVQMELVQDGWMPQWRVTRVQIPMPVLHQLQSHAT